MSFDKILREAAVDEFFYARFPFKLSFKPVFEWILTKDFDSIYLT